jgi:type II secretory pathway pseudopilin PulG
MMRRRPAGLTIVELLVVMGLLGLLLLVAVPNLNVPDTIQAYAPARELATDLRLARRLSVTQHVNYTLEFSPALPPYATYAVYNASSLEVEPGFPKQLPPGATVTGTRTITFIPTGCACPSTPTSDAVVDVAVGGATYRTTVTWYTGRVRVERVQ